MSWTPPCFGDSEERSRTELNKWQKKPLDAKIMYSMAKIKEFYLLNKGKVYVAFSGGKDSTVLIHLVRQIYPDAPAVFFNTGFEFPEIRDHVRKYENVEWIQPKMSPRKVIEAVGYPVVGKRVAHYVDLHQRGKPSGRKLMMDEHSKFARPKYEFLLDAPFRISDKCCKITKKDPAKEYVKRTGRHAIIGTRATESQDRAETWIKKGEFSDGNITPLSVWTDADIDLYISRYGLELSEIYGMGYERTGCAFCMFGIMQHPGRFPRLKASHPKLWAYCMKPFEDGGLGLKDVLDFLGMPTGIEQNNLDQFAIIVPECQEGAA